MVYRFYSCFNHHFPAKSRVLRSFHQFSTTTLVDQTEKWMLTRLVCRLQTTSARLLCYHQCVASKQQQQRFFLCYYQCVTCEQQQQQRFASQRPVEGEKTAKQNDANNS